MIDEGPEWPGVLALILIALAAAVAVLAGGCAHVVANERDRVINNEALKTMESPAGQAIIRAAAGEVAAPMMQDGIEDMFWRIVKWVGVGGVTGLAVWFGKAHEARKGRLWDAAC